MIGHAILFQVEKSAPSKLVGKNTVMISISAQPVHQRPNSKQGKHAPFYLHDNSQNINIDKEIGRKISTTVINQTNGYGIKSEDITGKNCVSFNLDQQKNKTELKYAPTQPNGILKNGFTCNVPQVQMSPSQPNKSPSKSITFACHVGTNHYTILHLHVE